MRVTGSHFVTMVTVSATLHASTILYPWGSLFSTQEAPQKLRVTLTQYDEISTETAAPRPVLKQERAKQQLQPLMRKVAPTPPKRVQPKKRSGNTIPVSQPTQQRKVNKIESPDPTADLTRLQRDRGAKFKISYEQAVVAWLEKHKRYPRRALKRNLEGEGVLALRLSPKGEVLARELKASSGCSLLDEEITRMVDRAGTFPKIPTALPQRAMSFTIPIAFQIS